MQFLKKLVELPEEVRLYFGSPAEYQATKEIETDYQLSSDDLDNIVNDIFIADFSLASLDGALKATKVPAPSQSKLAADILGKLFLPVAAFLKIDVKAEIIKRGHRPEIYQPYLDNFAEVIEDKNFESLEELVDLYESTFNPVEEENASLDLFTGDLKGILNDTDIDAVNTLNGALIYLLSNKPDFHNKINKTLLDNQEVITTQSLTWAEGAKAGTAANWLKDFIKENGSDIYNSVVLSRYLATSPNPQLLTEGERKIVRRLLRLYRNLVFFPESMSDVPMEEWEIIPVEKVSVEKPILGKPKDNPAPVVIENKEEVKAVAVAPAVKKIVTPKLVATKVPMEIAKAGTDPEEAKLISLLTKYAPNSLEARVVKEEIKRRRKKS
ncbi:hypothetical protein COX21_02185 [Candidatus Falkowbacteria bacterium CG23_combo_of_CG06-09_8_20_14_all_41_10]|uniref:Uncharacterized protein n=1 Tax=Candidatus Falkowbacteria bacterium CG23_combo_of_CG06-09_8_20_14_all_41_10 TaxID=1974571 RepID=A0A2G9ZN02_9BACT|nr:MAG: hypothetical protein COX21_02185 [Candidatus Falkowbacteria bacterium CG23_combo_of_CG06-09_8_20_14_all_41_10]